jgi:hypothetical protein
MLAARMNHRDPATRRRSRAPIGRPGNPGNEITRPPRHDPATLFRVAANKPGVDVNTCRVAVNTRRVAVNKFRVGVNKNFVPVNTLGVAVNKFGVAVNTSFVVVNRIRVGINKLDVGANKPGVAVNTFFVAVNTFCVDANKFCVEQHLILERIGPKTAGGVRELARLFPNTRTEEGHRRPRTLPALGYGARTSTRSRAVTVATRR